MRPLIEEYGVLQILACSGTNVWRRLGARFRQKSRLICLASSQKVKNKTRFSINSTRTILWKLKNRQRQKVDLFLEKALETTSQLRPESTLVPSEIVEEFHMTSVIAQELDQVCANLQNKNILLIILQNMPIQQERVPRAEKATNQLKSLKYQTSSRPHPVLSLSPASLGACSVLEITIK